MQLSGYSSHDAVHALQERMLLNLMEGMMRRQRPMGNLKYSWSELKISQTILSSRHKKQRYTFALLPYPKPHVSYRTFTQYTVLFIFRLCLLK